MLKVNHTLVLTVSALALSAGNVSAAFPNPPLASVLCTKLHTTTGGRGKFAAEESYPEARCSEILLSQAHCRSQTCHNVQSSAHASFSTVIPNQILSSSGLTRGSRSNIDSLATWMPVSSTGMTGDRELAPSAGTMRTPVRIYAEVIKPLADGVKLPQLASVCFITDTNDCSGNTFGGGEGYPNKPNPIDPIQPVPDEDKCSELGFKKTSCSEGYSPAGFCPYDSSFFKECVCTETCPNGYQDYPCGSGLLQVGTAALNCKTCYKCTACDDKCPSGHTTESGACRQASSYVTECGNKCYKILSNSCKSGSLSAPAESGGYRNKIVSYTECGNPCFQSFNDNCASGYVKTKESGKCYETTAKYTDYGTACYKEKTCCTPNCPSPWSLTKPSGDYISAASNCSGTYCYKSCSVSCPSGTTESNPGGCGGSVQNECKTKTCYYPYKKCCTPQSNESGCQYGTTSCSDGCGGTRLCCKSCNKSPSISTKTVTVSTTCEAFNKNGAKSRNCYNQKYYECSESEPDAYGCYQRVKICAQNSDDGWYFVRNQSYCNMQYGFSNADCTGNTINFTYGK